MSIQNDPTKVGTMGLQVGGLHTLSGLTRFYPPSSIPVNSTAFTSDGGQVVNNGTAWVRSSGGAQAWVYNALRSNTNKWRAARGKVQSGVSNARVMCVGNSITAGYGSVTNASSSASASRSYPTLLASLLSARGLNASNSSFIGGQNYVNFNDTDSRIVMGSWTNSGLGTFGGNCLTLGATGQTLMSFTPTNQVDTVDVIALRNSSAARLTLAVDGGATLFTLNPFGTGTLKMSNSGGPFSLGTLGNHAIQINISVATATFLIGMIAWNSAVKEVSVLRGGWQGAITSNFLDSAPWSYLDGIRVTAPDLTLIALTRNDATNATDLTTFKTQYQGIINASITSGDVILIIEPMGSLDSGVYARYVDAVYSLAVTNNLPVIDFTGLWDSYSNITAWYGDATHPVGFAYADMARQIGNILIGL